jgi:hypothetical protein
VTTQEQMLEQVYGLLDDWKAQQFGGEPIVEAINNLTAVSGTATRQELERIVEGVQNLAEVLATQQVLQAAELTAALQALAAGGTSFTPATTDPSDEARAKIRANVEEISLRMGKKLGTGNEALEIGPADTIALSEFDPILPVPIRAGGDATIYGAGLDNVVAVLVDGQSATIGRVLPGEVDFTVPADVPASGVATIEVITIDAASFTFDVAVTGGVYTVQKLSRKGVKN